jgi:hypothetical protein
MPRRKNAAKVYEYEYGVRDGLFLVARQLKF